MNSEDNDAHFSHLFLEVFKLLSVIIRCSVEYIDYVVCFMYFINYSLAIYAKQIITFFFLFCEIKLSISVLYGIYRYYWMSGKFNGVI